MADDFNDGFKQADGMTRPSSDDEVMREMIHLMRMRSAQAEADGRQRDRHHDALLTEVRGLRSGMSRLEARLKALHARMKPRALWLSILFSIAALCGAFLIQVYGTLLPSRPAWADFFEGIFEGAVAGIHALVSWLAADANWLAVTVVCVALFQGCSDIARARHEARRRQRQRDQAMQTIANLFPTAANDDEAPSGPGFEVNAVSFIDRRIADRHVEFEARLQDTLRRLGRLDLMTGT